MDWQKLLKPFSENLVLCNCYKCYHKDKPGAFQSFSLNLRALLNLKFVRKTETKMSEIKIRYRV